MIEKRYVLFKKVARGGMAEIFLGKLIGEDGFERVCCFKRILPHFAAEKDFIEMFRDEAHIGKRLQHANIVRVEGFEEVDGAYAIIMEFIAGADLRSILTACEQHKLRIPIPIAVLIIAESARGLHYAHMKKDDITANPLNIVHRDISPQNILISFEGEVKVTDFGIADASSKLTDTKTGVVKGKFSYMSPEQISAQSVDARTDIFALAIILWELVTMRRLFNADNEAIVIQLVRDCIIPEDNTIYNSDLDQDLDRIIRKGLAKNVKDRYETAALFEKDLRMYLSKKYPDFSSDDLGKFLKDLMPDREKMLANDIKELLMQKESGRPKVEIDLRAPAPGQGSLVGRPPAIGRPPLAGGTNAQHRMSGTQSGYKVNSGGTRGNVIDHSRNLGSQPPYPKSGQATARRSVPPPRVEESNFFWKLLIALILLSGVGAAGHYFWTHRKSTDIALITWTVRTVPSSVRLQLDGEVLFGDHYVKTPIELKSLNPGSHTLLAMRPGFETETLSIVLSAESASHDSILTLKQAERMAPLRLSLKSPVPPLHITMDDGLVDEELSYDQPLNVSGIVFGKDHVLIVNLSEDSSFSCQFAPRAQTWEAPFLVVIDTDAKKCSYPLR